MVSLTKDVQQTMGVEVPPTPQEVQQQKVHDGVRADMEAYRGVLDIQIIEAKGLRPHTAGDGGLCICGIKVKNNATGEIVSSWSIGEPAAKPATSAQWMQSTPFTDKLQVLGADCALEFEVLELPSSGSKSYMGGARLQLLPLISEQSTTVSFGTDADLSEAPMVLTMEFAPSGSDGEASGTLHVQVTIEPEDDENAQRGRQIREHSAEITTSVGPSNMPLHERARLVAEATRTMKKELCELLSAQHALVVSSLGAKPLGWSSVVPTVDEADDVSELQELQLKIEQVQDQISGMQGGPAKAEAQKMVVALEEQRLTKSGLALRRVIESSVWEGNGPMQELDDMLNEIKVGMRRVDSSLVVDWDDVLSWCDLSNVWVESKLFESACYASYTRMRSDVMQHSDAISMAVGEGLAVLGGSYRWDETYEDIYQRMNTAKETVDKMRDDLTSNTITDSIVTPGELLELASVVSHLQEENEMLWDRVHSTGHAMVNANKTLEEQQQSSASGAATAQQMIQQAEHKALLNQQAKIQAEKMQQQAEQALEEESRSHRSTTMELERTRQLASQEDEATLKDHRRRLTEELLDVESKLVAALEEREQLKSLLEGDTSALVDKEYWASAMALLLERAQLHENQTLLAAQYQETQLQNRALAGQVVDLENQLMQAQTALSAWNALNVGKPGQT